MPSSATVKNNVDRARLGDVRRDGRSSPRRHPRLRSLLCQGGCRVPGSREADALPSGSWDPTALSSTLAPVPRAVRRKGTFHVPLAGGWPPDRGLTHQSILARRSFCRWAAQHAWGVVAVCGSLPGVTLVRPSSKGRSPASSREPLAGEPPRRLVGGHSCRRHQVKEGHRVTLFLGMRRIGRIEGAEGPWRTDVAAQGQNHPPSPRGPKKR